MRIGRQEFDVEHGCYIMGILNVTPDSFSDGGRWMDLEQAKRRSADMVAGGASIIDVGGESTRPGHTPVSIQEEIDRVVPAIEMLKASFHIPVSVDTWKSEVAEAALRAGADLVNDVWGLRRDRRMASVIAAYQAPCCLTHNRERAEYDDLLEEVCEDLRQSLNIAGAAGVAEEGIILDPGVGFGKTCAQNLRLIRQLDRLAVLGRPILLGASRKSFIGLTLDLPPQERLEGTLAATVLGVERGAAFIRVHDVRENYRAMRIARAILDEGRCGI